MKMLMKNLLLLIGFIALLAFAASSRADMWGPGGGSEGVYGPASSGSGDVVGPASTVDSEFALWDSTTGALLKSMTCSGYAYATSGVASCKSGASTTYARGDGTVSTLDTAAVPENGNLYSTNARVLAYVLTGYSSGAGTVAATDTILQAFQKLNGNQVLSKATADAALPSASFTDTAVTSKLITNFVSGAGTVAATDTILQAINKLDGNIAGKQASGNYVTALTGDVTASGPGSVAATVALVGGYSAANVAAGATLANAATDANTASAIVKRDSNGDSTHRNLTVTRIKTSTNSVGVGNNTGTNADSVYVGKDAGETMSGGEIVAIGNYTCGGGAGNYGTGAYSVCVGRNAGGRMQSAADGSTWIGNQAGNKGTGYQTGNNNTGVGYYVLQQVTGAAASNTALGKMACDGVSTGSNNLCLGADTDVPVATNSDQLALGDFLWGTSTTLYGDGTKSFYGLLQSQVASTTTTLAITDCGKTIVNNSADVVTLPLTTDAPGCRITFIVGNASNFDVNPNNSDQILVLTDAAGDAIRSATLGHSVVLEAITGNYWSPVGKEQGTWTDVN